MEENNKRLKQYQVIPKADTEDKDAYNKTLDDKIEEFIIKSPDGQFSCAFCGKLGVRKRIKDHVEIHIQGIVVTCEFCGKSYGTRRNLLVHKYSQNRNKIVKR